MTCREMTEFLADYIVGELEPDVHAEFETHLSACPNCTTYMVQYRGVIVAARTAYDADGQLEAESAMPDELVRIILQSIDKTP